MCLDRILGYRAIWSVYAHSEAFEARHDGKVEDREGDKESRMAGDVCEPEEARRRWGDCLQCFGWVQKSAWTCTGGRACYCMREGEDEHDQDKSGMFLTGLIERGQMTCPGWLMCGWTVLILDVNEWFGLGQRAESREQRKLPRSGWLVTD